MADRIINIDMTNLSGVDIVTRAIYAAGMIYAHDIMIDYVRCDKRDQATEHLYDEVAVVDPPREVISLKHGGGDDAA